MASAIRILAKASVPVALQTALAISSTALSPRFTRGRSLSCNLCLNLVCLISVLTRRRPCAPGGCARVWPPAVRSIRGRTYQISQDLFRSELVLHSHSKTFAFFGSHGGGLRCEIFYPLCKDEGLPTFGPSRPENFINPEGTCSPAPEVFSPFLLDQRHGGPGRGWGRHQLRTQGPR
jgi:hypothetical protein